MAVTYIVGDTPLLQIEVKDRNGAMDLTGATVTIRFSIDGAETKTGSVTVTDAPNGLGQYRFLSTDLDQAGALSFEVRVVNGSYRNTSRTYMRAVREPL